MANLLSACMKNRTGVPILSFLYHPSVLLGSNFPIMDNEMKRGV